MQLQRIKEFCKKRNKAVKDLAATIGMSEQNLHRCIREEKIQAQDLENIAKELQVPVTAFYDAEVEVVMEKKEFIHTGDHGTMADHIDKVEVHDQRDTKKASSEKSEEAKPTYAELEAKVSDLQQRLLDAQSEIISLMKQKRL